MQWYCHVGGQQYGPVEEAVIRQWISEGRLAADDIVWREGMAQWQRCDVTPPFASMFASFNRVIYGTGGRNTNPYIMAQARSKLAGKWWKFFGVFFAFSILMNIAMSIANQITQLPLLQLIIQGPITLGISLFFLMAIRSRQPGFATFFMGFRNFGKAFVLNLLMGIFIFLWTLLLIIPGIIAALNYAMAFYILADNPAMSPMDAISASKKLMRGHRWKYFCLNFRFFWLFLIVGIGIGLIVAIPLGIALAGAENGADGASAIAMVVTIIIGGIGLIAGIIASMMITIYFNTSDALFYEDIHPEAAAEPVEESTPPPLEQQI